MTTTQKWPITPPSLFDTLQLLKRDILTSVNCMKIGQIQSYDSTKATATVQVMLKRVLPSGIISEYPLLVDCPVVTLQGGGATIQLPIAAGDYCLLVFSDRNLDAWYQTGSANPPADGRCHDLSDAIALVGLNSQASPPTAAPASTVRIAYAGATLDLTGGTIKLKASGTGEIDLGTLVSIKNGTTSLLTLLDGLIDIIAAAALDVGHATLASSTITALNTYKTTIAGLLS